MEQIHKKTNGIGHNSNILKDKSPTAKAIGAVTKEQYAKLMQSMHHLCIFARQELRRVREMHDSAFTGHWKGYGDKLKTHEKHEERLAAKALENKFAEHCNEHIADLEARAKAEGVELKDRETDPEKEKHDS